MKILKIIILFFLIIVVFFVVFGYLYFYVLFKGFELIILKLFEIGKGNFVMFFYKYIERKSICVWIYKLDFWEFDNIVFFVMYGMVWNVENYFDVWVDIVERKNILFIVLEFENEFYWVIINDY